MSRSAAVSRQATAALRMFCTGSSPGAAAATDACASQLLTATPPTTPPAPSRLRTVRRPSSIDPPTLHCVRTPYPQGDIEDRDPTAQPRPLAVGEVGEAAVVQLVGDGDRAGGAVAVLGEDEIGLARAGVVALEGVGAVQEDDHVGVLLDAVVRGNPVGDEVVSAGHGGVIDRLLADALDRHDLVPEHVVG